MSKVKLEYFESEEKRKRFSKDYFISPKIETEVS